jgi:formylglycine-generating enzyme required for sulfatase activity
MAETLALLSVQHNTAPSASNASFWDRSECPEMVVIPAGSFTIGSPATEKDRYVDEDPRRQVSIRRFAIGKFDVTRAQWAGFVTATKRDIPLGCTWTGRTKMDVDQIGSWRNLGFEQDDTHPVVCVTWNDARDYAHWLSQKTGKKYRLSSEAEWEYSARAGTVTAYPWGSIASHESANYGADNWGGLASGLLNNSFSRK